MILLDTNILSELMRPRPDSNVLEWLDEQYDADLFISAITRAEIELGVAMLSDGKRKMKLVSAAKEMFEEFSERCLPFDETAAIEYGQLVARRISIGRPISVEDAQIAAIALVHDLYLATRNIKDFNEIYGLRLIDPWQKRLES